MDSARRRTWDTINSFSCLKFYAMNSHIISSELCFTLIYFSQTLVDLQWCYWAFEDVLYYLWLEMSTDVDLAWTESSQISVRCLDVEVLKNEGNFWSSSCSRCNFPLSQYWFQHRWIWAWVQMPYCVLYKACRDPIPYPSPDPALRHIGAAHTIMAVEEVCPSGRNHFSQKQKRETELFSQLWNSTVVVLPLPCMPDCASVSPQLPARQLSPPAWCTLCQILLLEREVKAAALLMPLPFCHRLVFKAV